MHIHIQLFRPIVAGVVAVLLAACNGGLDPDRGGEAASAGSSSAPGATTPATRDDADTADTRKSASEDVDAESATPQERHRRGDRSCARLVTRTRSVASVSGGAMQMIMVTECVPAKG